MTLNNQSLPLSLLNTEDKRTHARERKSNKMVKRHKILQSCIIDLIPCKDIHEYAVVSLKVIGSIDDSDIGAAADECKVNHHNQVGSTNTNMSR